MGDMGYLGNCTYDGREVGSKASVVTLAEIWSINRGWVCTGVDMILLGIIFRFLAALCLVLYMQMQTSRLSVFFGGKDANSGTSKVLGKLITLAVGSFLVLFLFAEVWFFSVRQVDVAQLFSSLRGESFVSAA